MSTTLIPFGLLTDSNELVDVAEVPNGKKCGCICPSCNTPLVARQGEQNVWHFSHANRKVSNKTKNECHYSFYLSLRLMARQIISNEMTILLPEFKKVISDVTQSGYRESLEFTITPSSKVSLSDIEVETQFHGVNVDFIGKINGYTLCLYFTHPERYPPHELTRGLGGKEASVEVKLDTLYEKFITNRMKEEKVSFKEILLNFLQNDLSSKNWLFHPRLDEAQKTAQETLKSQLISKEQERQALMKEREAQYSIIKRRNLKPSPFNNIPTHKPKDVSPKKTSHKCSKCGTEWPISHGYICPSCFKVCRTSQ